MRFWCQRKLCGPSQMLLCSPIPSPARNISFALVPICGWQRLLLLDFLKYEVDEMRCPPFGFSFTACFAEWWSGTCLWKIMGKRCVGNGWNWARIPPNKRSFPWHDIIQKKRAKNRVNANYVRANKIICHCHFLSIFFFFFLVVVAGSSWSYGSRIGWCAAFRCDINNL